MLSSISHTFTPPLLPDFVCRWTPNREPHTYKNLDEPPSHLSIHFLFSIKPNTHLLPRLQTFRNQQYQTLPFKNRLIFLLSFLALQPSHRPIPITANMCTIINNTYTYCSHRTSETVECAQCKASKNGICPGPKKTIEHSNDGDCGCGASRRRYR